METSASYALDVDPTIQSIKTEHSFVALQQQCPRQAKLEGEQHAETPAQISMDYAELISTDLMDQADLTNMLLSEISAKKTKRISSVAAAAAVSSSIATTARTRTSARMAELPVLVSRKLRSHPAVPPTTEGHSDNSNTVNEACIAVPAIGKTPQQSASTPSTVRGTGGGSYFRRKKIVPSVVAKKVGNSKPTKDAPCDEAPVNRMEGLADPNATSEEIASQPQSSVQPPDTELTARCSPSTKVIEETDAKNEKESESTNTRSGAFRRIKAKVSILPTPPKASKSILKLSNSPNKNVQSDGHAESKTPKHGIVEVCRNAVSEPPDDVSTQNRNSQHRKEDELEEKSLESACSQRLSQSTEQTVETSSVPIESERPLVMASRVTSEPSENCTGVSTDTQENKLVQERHETQNSTLFLGRQSVKSTTLSESSHENALTKCSDSQASQNTLPSSATAPDVTKRDLTVPAENNHTLKQLPNVTVGTGSGTKQIKRAIFLGTLLSNKQLKESLAKAITKPKRFNGKTIQSKSGEPPSRTVMEVKVHSSPMNKPVTDPGTTQETLPCSSLKSTASESDVTDLDTLSVNAEQPSSVISCHSRKTDVIDLDSVATTSKKPLFDASHLSSVLKEINAETQLAAAEVSAQPEEKPIELVAAETVAGNASIRENAIANRVSVLESSIKKVQKIPLTPQIKLLLERSSKGKVKRTAKTKNANPVLSTIGTGTEACTGRTIPESSHSSTESAPIQSSVKVQQCSNSLVPESASSQVPTSTVLQAPQRILQPGQDHGTVSLTTNTIGPSGRDPKVNIISQCILPSIVISNPSGAACTGNIIPSFGPIPVGSVPTINLANFLSVSSPEVTPLQLHSLPVDSENLPSSIVPVQANVSQYPKVYVLHRPDPPDLGANPNHSPVKHFLHPNSAARLIDPRPSLPKPSVSVTVLSKPISSACLGRPVFAPAPRPMPTPFVTVTTLPEKAPKASETQSLIPSQHFSMSMESNIVSTSSSKTENVDPRVVPRIVIDHCYVEQDNQSSSSSTSSSVSSTSSIHQDGNRKGMACSLSIRNKLRAKALKNLENKSELGSDTACIEDDYKKAHTTSGNQSCQIAKMEHSVRYGRCYQRKSHTRTTQAPPTQDIQSAETTAQLALMADDYHYRLVYQRQTETHTAQAVLSDTAVDNVLVSVPTESHETTVEQQDGTNNNNYVKPSESQDVFKLTDTSVYDSTFNAQDYSNDTNFIGRSTETPEPPVCETQSSFATKSFLGFSNSSIETAERDFEFRTRVIDGLLEPGENLATDEGEETFPTSFCSVSIVADDASAATCSFGSNQEETFDDGAVAINDTFVDLQASNGSPANIESQITKEPNQFTFHTEQTVVVTTKENDMLHQEDRVDVEKLDLSEEANHALPLCEIQSSINVTSSSGDMADIKKVVSDDAIVKTKHESEASITPKVQNQTHIDVVEVHEEPMENVHDTMPSCHVPSYQSEDPKNAEDAVSMSSEPKEIPSYPASSVAEHGTTGVDVMVAMANLMRQTRMLSQDCEANPEDLLYFQSLSACNSREHPALAGIRREKRRKKKRKNNRNAFMQLLLKHVNYEALIADIVKQEKRRFGIVSSASSRSGSDEEMLVQNSSLPVHEHDEEEPEEVRESEDNNQTTGLNKELVEQILRPFLAKPNDTEQFDVSGDVASGDERSKRAMTPVNVEESTTRIDVEAIEGTSTNADDANMRDDSRAFERDLPDDAISRVPTICDTSAEMHSATDVDVALCDNAPSPSPSIRSVDLSVEHKDEPTLEIVTTCDNTPVSIVPEKGVDSFDALSDNGNGTNCDTTSKDVIEKGNIEQRAALTETNQSSDTLIGVAADNDTLQMPRKRRKTTESPAMFDDSRKRKVDLCKRATKSAPGRCPRKKQDMTNRTILAVRSMFDDCDAAVNEVVSDCSSDGLSMEEIAGSQLKNTIENPLDKSTVSGNSTLMYASTGGGSGDGGSDCTKVSFQPKERRKRLTTRSKRRATRNRGIHPDRSSSSSSSDNENNDTCVGHPSSGDAKSLLAAKRPKLRRKMRVARHACQNRERTVPTASTTVSATTSAPNVSSVSSIASNSLKASNTDDHYVISEIVPSEDEATAAIEPIQQRLLEVVSVRNNQVLQTAKPGMRLTRSTATEFAPPEPVPAPPVQKPGRGRPPKSKESGSTKSGKASKQLSKQRNVCDDPTATFKCANCGKEVVAPAWDEHYAHHNGITYRVNIDEPFDLRDFKTLSSAIMRYMKLYKRNDVACERCGVVKKSFVGLASHMQMCGLSKDEQQLNYVSCEHCHRRMKAVSLQSHRLQHCKVLKQQQQQQKREQEEHRAMGIIVAEDDSAIVEDICKQTDLTASGRKKRKSVASAEHKIKKLAKETHVPELKELVVEVTDRTVSNAILQCWMTHLKQLNDVVCTVEECPFAGLSSEYIRDRYSSSTEGKALFQCAKCNFLSAKRSAVYAHLNKTHPEEVRALAELHASITGAESDSASDLYVMSGDPSTEDYSSTQEGNDDDFVCAKKEKKSSGSTNKKQASKNNSKDKATGKRSNAGKQVATGSEVADSTVTNDDTDVYREMVMQESNEYRTDRSNFQYTSVRWMLDFRREHFSITLLFANLRPDTDIRLLSMSALKSYLPASAHSMRFVQCNAAMYEPTYKTTTFENSWRQLATLQGEAQGCESLFYCGGPVVSLDWLPLPDGVSDCDQFLAVVCKQNHDEYYNCEELSGAYPPRKCLIQIWNVGPVQNSGLSIKQAVRCPQLSFAIACDFGPILQIAFCPSGCYNEVTSGDAFDRLGLLAVAGSDGDVRLFAINPSLVETQTDQVPAVTPRIVTLQPVMRLSLSLKQHSTSGAASDFTGRAVVCISWSRERGHAVLAAGYSNGVVAVWNLTTEATLLCGTKDGVRTLLPVHKVLHSSSSCITALDLHYGSGSRYLVVCNADRRMKVYDLRCGQYQPFEVCSMLARSRIAAMRWLLHFPVLMIAYDDVYWLDRCAFTVHQMREIGLRMFALFTISAEATDIGVNDWTSTNVVATNGGDLVCHRPMPLVHGISNKKIAQVLTTTVTVKTTEIDETVSLTSYDNYSKNFGLVFSDTDKVPSAMSTKALQVKTWRRGHLNQYPAVRINQIRWNPNSCSYFYYAVGYQAGFVRIRMMRL